MKKILLLAKNRYVIVGLFMASWILFFDRYNVFKRWDDSMELHKLKQERTYYIKQIAEIKKKSDELLTSPESMERFARERYFMKKDNEEVYIVEEGK
jgi:cell division protein FtsB